MITRDADGIGAIGGVAGIGVDAGGVADPPALGRTSRRWLGPSTVRLAWAALVVAIIHPPHGTGITVCWFRATTGVPCPGCGLTRSLSCAVRGMFAESWSYHRFGIVLLAFFAAVAALSIAPRRWRTGLAAAIDRHPRVANTLLAGAVVLFIALGARRAIEYVIAMGGG